MAKVRAPRLAEPRGTRLDPAKDEPPEAGSGSSDIEGRILAELEGKPDGLSAKELADRLDEKKDALKRPLRRLLESGQVSRLSSRLLPGTHAIGWQNTLPGPRR